MTAVGFINIRYGGRGVVVVCAGRMSLSCEDRRVSHTLESFRNRVEQRNLRGALARCKVQERPFEIRIMRSLVREFAARLTCFFFPFNYFLSIDNFIFLLSSFGRNK